MRSSHAMLRSCEGSASHWANAGQQGVATDEGRRSRYALPLAFAAEWADRERERVFVSGDSCREASLWIEIASGGVVFRRPARPAA